MFRKRLKILLFEPSDNTIKCTECEEMFYCCQACKTSDWDANHQYHECEILATDEGKKCPKMSKQSYRLALRFMLKLKYEFGLLDKKFKLYHGKTRRVDDLVSHEKRLQGGDGIFMQASTKAAKRFFQMKVVDNENEFARRLSQLETNCFSINAEHADHKSISDPGTGLYVEASNFDHSCRPNACRTFDGVTLQIRAIQNITTSREKILVGYCDVMNPRNIRQHTLNTRYNFHCKCVHCVKDCRPVVYEMFQKLHKSYKKFQWMGLFKEAAEDALKALRFVQEVQGKYSSQGSFLYMVVADNYFRSLARGETVNLGVSLYCFLEQAKESLKVTMGEEHEHYQLCVRRLESIEAHLQASESESDCSDSGCVIQ